MMLYIHIPFCAHKCGYCAFNSLPAPKDSHAPYMRALLQQLKFELEKLESQGAIFRKNGADSCVDSSRFYASKNEQKSKLKCEKIESVYIGGGTPSLVDSSLYEPIFAEFAPFLAKDAEITIEGNPSSILLSWASDMRALGVNRASLGVQSFFSDKLKWLERDHKEGDTERAVSALFEAGFRNISIDLLYDTPFDSPLRLEREIARAGTLEIDHLSAYSLTLEEGSRFFGRFSTDEICKESKGELVRALLSERGFLQYEVSNYARNYRSRHNLGYWEAREYIGVGAGAVGCVKGVRYEPHKEVARYISNPIFRKDEWLSAHDLRFERLFLGLRSCVGVSKNDVQESKLNALLEAQKVRIERGRILASDYFLADEIALFLV